MSLTVKHLNADASFLLIFSPEAQPSTSDLRSTNGAYTILVDPWLTGTSMFRKHGLHAPGTTFRRAYNTFPRLRSRTLSLYRKISQIIAMAKRFGSSALRGRQSLLLSRAQP